MDRELIRIACDESYANAQGGAYPPNVPRAADEDQQLQQAMQLSLGDKRAEQLFDFESIDEKMRQSGVPVGLVNMGNSMLGSDLVSVACYFNSLLQSYFMLPQFVEQVLKFVQSPDEVSPAHESVSTMSA